MARRNHEQQKTRGEQLINVVDVVAVRGLERRLHKEVSSMKIAITGAGGFLGTEILTQLSSEKDILVYAFTFDFERARTTFVRSDNIIPVDNCEVTAFDYSDIDVLLNCTFPRNVGDASFAGGLDFIQKVFLKASADRVKSVVNISSQSVYSQKRKNPADEKEPIILESKYAVGKYASELLTNSLFQNCRHTNLRMASLIGAGFPQRITNKFASKVIAGEQITITGGQQLFGFLDVRDAAGGIIRAAKSIGEWKEVYNLGTDKYYSLEEIARSAVEEGIKAGYNSTEIILEKNDDLWQNSSLICNRFYKDFDWNPHYMLEDTMVAIYRSLKEQEICRKH